MMVSVISAKSKLVTVSDRRSVKWVLTVGMTFMLRCSFRVKFNFGPLLCFLVLLIPFLNTIIVIIIIIIIIPYFKKSYQLLSSVKIKRKNDIEN